MQMVHPLGARMFSLGFLAICLVHFNVSSCDVFEQIFLARW